MSFPKCKLVLFAAIALSMATMLAAKEEFNATSEAVKTATLQPNTVTALNLATATLGKIGGSNKLLKAVVAPVISLCSLCLGGVFPSAVKLLYISTASLVGLASALRAPLLPKFLPCNPAFATDLSACIANLLSCIAAEPSLLVKFLLAIILALLLLLKLLLF